jgi:hypothetical protein
MKQPNTYLFNEEGGEGGSGGGAGAGAGSGGASLLGQGAEGAASAQGGAAASAQGGQGGTGGEGAFDFRSLIGDDGKFVPGYHEKLPESLKEHSKHFQKYTDPLQALQHTLNLQQLLGQKANAVVIPDKDAPAEAWKPVLAKLGVPDTPDGYGLKVPENLPEGVTVDEAEIKEFAGFAHQLGLTPAQVAKLQEYDLARAGKYATGSAEAAAAIEAKAFDEQKQLLAKEWGNGPEATQKRALAERAALTFGFTPEELKTEPLFRNARFVMTLARAGAVMSEDTLVKGSDVHSVGGLKARAQDVINNQQNPLYKRYWNGDEDTVSQVRAWMRAAS